ncbi:MAG: hypothetical protein DSY85_16665 [Marinomonas sp.]|nr:MAG: hypothetical protein DSY85_16665 [Marinomonas sp.]
MSIDEMSYIEICDDLIKVKMFGWVNRFDDYPLVNIKNLNANKIEFYFDNVEGIDNFFVSLFYLLNSITTSVIEFKGVNQYCRDVLDMACINRFVDY